MLRHVLADQEGRAFKQGAVNPLPAAGAAAHFQGRQDADDAEHAAYHVDHRCAGAQRLSRRTGHICQSAHHLGDLVQRGALLVGAGKKAPGGVIQQPGVVLRQIIVTVTGLVHGAGPEILDKYVGLADQAHGNFPAPFRFEVDADTALVAVIHGKVTGARTAQSPGIISPQGFQLDNVGTQVGKQQTDAWPHHHVGEFNNPDAGKR